MQLEPALIHPDMVEHIGNFDERFIDMTGFRGSAKSVFGSLALPLFLALEYPKLFPFIIPCADTSVQAALNIANIKNELEYNELLLQDYGRFEYEKLDDPNPEPTLESDEEWQAKNMLLSNGVRILARSRGQKIRGLRHREHRPKQVIADDVEDLEWVHSKENRDKTERWLRGEVIPAIDQTMGRLLVIGNHLHTDALMSRLRKDKSFIHLEYPLVDKDGKCLWPAMYPTQKSLDELRDRVKAVAYQREYLLRVVPEEGTPIKPEWIVKYDKAPIEMETGMMGTGIDFAISKKETADYTSMVSGVSFHDKDGKPRIFIKPNPINDRLSFHDTIQVATAIVQANPFCVLFPEDVQYQRAAIEEMERQLLPVRPMKPGADKRARLMSIAPYIQNGTVQFPENGCEDLLIQLLGFGIEEHDDLVDALVYCVLGLVQQGLERMEVVDLFSISNDETKPNTFVIK